MNKTGQIQSLFISKLRAEEENQMDALEFCCVTNKSINPGTLCGKNNSQFCLFKKTINRDKFRATYRSETNSQISAQPLRNSWFCPRRDDVNDYDEQINKLLHFLERCDKLEKISKS